MMEISSRPQARAFPRQAEAPLAARAHPAAAPTRLRQRERERPAPASAPLGVSAAGAAPPPAAMRLDATGAAAGAAAAPAAEAATPRAYHNFTLTWNGSDFFYNVSNTSEIDYDYSSLVNGTIDDTSWSFCKEWTPAQHNLFQTANFFFAAAFLVPSTFKQSVLLVRALLSLGCFLTAVWAGAEVCALDILLWNSVQVVLNCTHTALLAWRFLPPTLTLELTDLYIKVFKPLKVSKKHFKELVKEARVMSLDQGDIYAVEDVSPADERLSILLKGKLRVTCDDTHLHWVGPHQFVDSPEWEANREQSDDVFQVTITAEEDSVYLCWPRMRLERVLRHRPKLKIVLDCIIGKDITQKLYALNEHLMGMSDDASGHKIVKNKKRGPQALSMSMDAVDTGATGLVRSQAWTQRDRSSLNGDGGSLDKFQRRSKQKFVPVVANQFPANSPFVAASAKAAAAVAAANAKTFKSPPAAVKSPHDVVKSPTAVVKSPHDVVKSPTTVVKSPHDVVKSPTTVVKSPTGSVKSPTSSVKSAQPSTSTGAVPKVVASTGAIPKGSSYVYVPVASGGSVKRAQGTPPRPRAKEVKFEATPSTSRR